MEIFNQYSNFYDLFYKEKNYKSEAIYVNSLLKKNNVPGSRLLEFGAGTGSHVRHLEKQGFEVHGIEVSPAMVSVAKQKGHKHIYVGNIQSFVVPKKFHAVVSLFHVMSYQTKNKEVKDVFQNASAHLKKGGLFLFDFWYSAAVINMKPKKKVKKINNRIYKLNRSSFPKIISGKNLVNILFKIKVFDKVKNKKYCFEELHKMRHFCCEELDSFAYKSGLIRINTEEFKTGKPPSKNTWGVCCLYKKI